MKLTAATFIKNTGNNMAVNNLSAKSTESSCGLVDNNLAKEKANALDGEEKDNVLALETHVSDKSTQQSPLVM